MATMQVIAGGGREARRSLSGRYDGGSATIALPWATDVHPAQFYPPRAAQPELCLAVAVLEDAVHVLRKYPRDNREWIRAAEWVLSTESVWPFSFLAICDLCGFQAEHVRRALFSHEVALRAKRLRTIRSHHKVHGTRLSHVGSRAHGAF